MKKILITGSQGFIGSYLCAEFLLRGYKVIGVDNFSKYGVVSRPHDFAIKLFNEQALKRILVISSSMVFESTTLYPTPEGEELKCPPPLSTYGFQKLSTEYFCKGAYEQYGLPYTIIRPFNCVGVGEEEMLNGEEVFSGNVKLMMSHVLPDLINKILQGQNPLHILGSGEQIRCYTNGKDIARGIRMALESEKGKNQDFNISSKIATSVLELANIIWKKLKPETQFAVTSDKAFVYDVQKRIPNTQKALDTLGFEAEISLEKSVHEVIEYMRKK